MPTILVAGRDPQQRTELRQHLEANKHQVVEARDYDQCLMAYVESRPALILLDADLRPHGFAACSQLRAMDAHLPILMMIPDDSTYIEGAFVSGATDILIKPVHPPAMVQRVRLLLESEEGSPWLAEQDGLPLQDRPIDDRLERAMWEARVEAEIRERERAEAAEREHRVLAEALLDIAAILNSALDLHEVLSRILACIHRVMPPDPVNIFLIDEQGVARNAGCLGYAELGVETQMRQLAMPVMDTPSLRTMVETRQPLLIPDTSKYPGWKLFAETLWIRSCLNAPICVENTVIGFLNVDSPVPNQYNEEHARRLQAFASQAGIAIRNARLYEASQQYAQELEYRAAERTSELESERAQLQVILDSMDEGVLGVLGESPQNSRWFLNRALRQMTGYDGAEQNLAVFKSATMSDDEFNRIMERITTETTNNGSWRGELRVRRRDGSEFDAALSVSRLNGADGEYLGSVTIIRDVSQEKALEAQQSRFVASASHELRTPITNLKTRLYLARRQPEKMEMHLRVLEQVVDQMKTLVDDLLDFSRFERGVINLRRAETELGAFLKNVVVIQQAEAERKGLALGDELPPYPIPVWIDASRINQVVTNLVTNAINHTPEGGSVTIRTFLDARGYAVVQVQDTGVGISPEHLPHIFQPFFQVHNDAGGSGLGLSIAKEIVELHGGRLTVESEVGRGTCFSMWLRVAEGAVGSGA